MTRQAIVVFVYLTIGLAVAVAAFAQAGVL